MTEASTPGTEIDLSETHARQVRVSGPRVQDVHFREHCAERAAQAAVTGWVSNELDGTVAARFEGTRGAVEDLVAWCRDGSPEAEVAEVSVETVEPEGLTEFTVHDGVA
ncbi:acylphosphatase [Nocardioidaceae bacterium]|nr:acylphosphatase [Nocardioidaceae bacterium]